MDVIMSKAVDMSYITQFVGTTDEDGAVDGRSNRLPIPLQTPQIQITGTKVYEDC